MMDPQYLFTGVATGLHCSSPFRQATNFLRATSRDYVGVLK